jgi:hypothetical protein
MKTATTRATTLQQRRQHEQAEMAAAHAAAHAEPQVTREETLRALQSLTRGMHPKEKARFLFHHGVRPVWTGGTTLRVLSLTGEDHTVTAGTDGSFTCDCIASHHGYERCTHVMLCELVEELENRPYEVQ